MTDVKTLQSRIEELESEVARLNKVNSVLMYRVEHSLDNSGDAYSLFESNILLQKTVNHQTSELKKEMIEREKIALQLRESRQRLLLHMQQTLFGVIEWDSSFKFIEWNKAAEKIFGYTREEVIGKHPFGMLYLDDLQDYVNDIFKNMHETRSSSRSVNENTTKDGKLIICDWYNTPLVDDNGKLMGMASLVQDITERITNENERKLRLERVQKQRYAIGRMTTDEQIVAGDFKSAVRTINEIVSTALDVDRVSFWKYDKEFSQGECVDLYESSKGIHKQGIILKTCDFPEYFKSLKEDRVIVSDDAWTDERLGEFTDSYHKPLNISSKLDIAVRVSGKLIGVVCNEHTGEPRVWQSDEIAFADEISSLLSQVYSNAKRKRSEQQKRQLQDRLERAERMESLGILAGGVAHDLNNILGPVVGYSELILLQLGEDNKIARQVDRINRSAQDAADVIQDLLTLARRGRYEMVPLSLNKIVTNFVESPTFLNLAMKNMEIEIAVNLDDSIGKMSGSSPHLSKVVMNLIINAFDAIPGEGLVTISTSQHYLEFLSNGHTLGELAGEYVTLSIVDTGNGIPSENLAKIFEPYYSKKKMGKNSGSGLGLSVVYGVVKDHKGFYDIITSPGNGTEFRLYFPVLNVTDDWQETIETEMGGTESILVIDDNEGQRDVATELISSMGYEVVAASGGEEAIEYLKEHSVDLVLLDMIMDPGIDGLDTYREIIKLHPGQKAIIASGFSATDRVEEMQKLGAGKYIKKPYTRQLLGRAIREELSYQMAPAAI